MPNYPVGDATWVPATDYRLPRVGDKEYWEAQSKKFDHELPPRLYGVPVNAIPVPTVNLVYDPLAERAQQWHLQQRIRDVNKEVKEIDEELDDLGVVPTVQVAQPTIQVAQPTVQVAQPYIPSNYGETLPRALAFYAPA